MVEAMRQPRRRRQEVEGRLAPFAPRAGRRSFPRRPDADGGERRAARRLRDELAALGPVFAACGDYLASRRDVFVPELCRELTGLAANVPPVSRHVVRQCLHRELGVSPEELFGRFEDQPREVRRLFQTHRAWLPAGQPVSVKLVVSRVELLADDLGLLDLLAPMLAPWAGGTGDGRIEEVLADAGRALGQELDLAREAEALVALAGTTASELRVPRVVRALSTSRVLTTERLDGVTLAEVGVGAVREGRISAMPGEIARRLCLAWLRQVLLGCRFPRLPLPENVAVTPDLRVVFLAGGFARPRPGWQERLWRYLTAAAAHDPERVGGALEALTSESPPGDGETLRIRLRQLQPPRGGRGSGDHLAEHLLLHWQLVVELGYRPEAALVDFYRALWALQEAVHGLAVDRDPVRDALDELSLDAEVSRLRQRMDLAQLGQDLRACTSLLSQLPQRLDAALSAAEGGLKLKLELRESPAENRRQSVPYTVLALLLALAAVTLLTEHLAGLQAAGGWSEKLGVIVFLVLGGTLLGVLGGARRRNS